MSRWGNIWSRLLLGLPLAVALVVLSGLLSFVWRFELAVSPAWQVRIYHLTLALVLSTTFVVASCRPFGVGERVRCLMVVLAVLAPVSVFTGSWFVGGPYEGFRDERVFGLVVVSVSSYILIWGALVVPYCVFVFGRAWLMCRRQGDLQH